MSSEHPAPPPYPMNYGPIMKPPGEGKAIASLVLGICSIVLWLCPLVGLVISIIGLSLGVSSNREYKRGLATAGIVLSVIGLILSVINSAWGAYLGATGQLRLPLPGGTPTTFPAP